MPSLLADLAVTAVKSLAVLSCCYIICYKFIAVLFLVYPEDGDSRLLQNIFNSSPIGMMSYFRRPELVV
jgi:hypothetical protein